MSIFFKFSFFLQDLHLAISVCRFELDATRENVVTGLTYHLACHLALLWLSQTLDFLLSCLRKNPWRAASFAFLVLLRGQPSAVRLNAIYIEGGQTLKLLYKSYGGDKLRLHGS